MNNRPKSISWKKKEVDDINLEWYEEAYDVTTDRLIFKFYYNKKDNNIYLIDIDDDVKYKIPKEEKAKGYVLAFKLIAKK